MRSVQIDNFPCPHCGETAAAIIDEESGMFCNSCRHDLTALELCPHIGALSERGYQIALEIITQRGSKQTVVMPLGWLAGEPVPLLEALKGLSSEMLGHASDLAHQADLLTAETERQALAARADDLRRYGWALWSIWLQLDPTAQATPDLAGMDEIAQQYRLSLPTGKGES